MEKNLPQEKIMTNETSILGKINNLVMTFINQYWEKFKNKINPVLSPIEKLPSDIIKAIVVPHFNQMDVINFCLVSKQFNLWGKCFLPQIPFPSLYSYEKKYVQIIQNAYEILAAFFDTKRKRIYTIQKSYYTHPHHFMRIYSYAIGEIEYEQKITQNIIDNQSDFFNGVDDIYFDENTDYLFLIFFNRGIKVYSLEKNKEIVFLPITKNKNYNTKIIVLQKKFLIYSSDASTIGYWHIANHNKNFFNLHKNTIIKNLFVTDTNQLIIISEKVGFCKENIEINIYQIILTNERKANLTINLISTNKLTYFSAAEQYKKIEKSTFIVIYDDKNKMIWFHGINNHLVVWSIPDEKIVKQLKPVFKMVHLSQQNIFLTINAEKINDYLYSNEPSPSYQSLQLYNATTLEELDSPPSFALLIHLMRKLTIGNTEANLFANTVGTQILFSISPSNENFECDRAYQNCLYTFKINYDLKLKKISSIIDDNTQCNNEHNLSLREALFSRN